MGFASNEVVQTSEVDVLLYPIHKRDASACHLYSSPHRHVARGQASATARVQASWFGARLSRVYEYVG